MKDRKENLKIRAIRAFHETTPDNRYLPNQSLLTKEQTEGVIRLLRTRYGYQKPPEQDPGFPAWKVTPRVSIRQSLHILWLAIKAVFGV